MAPKIRHPPVLLLIMAHWTDVAKLITGFAIVECLLDDRN
jgi:hypothetical protein